MSVGELFILGFFGKAIPTWLRQFAARYGLGGVILFDYSCQTRRYDNNIESPEQLRGLCQEISALPSGPMVFIDQEGGMVRRLKESSGFAPGTRDASLRSLQAGVDMLCIGNNLLNQEQKMADIADSIEQAVGNGILARSAIGKSIDRVCQRKALLI
jgi:beta-glucosidase-like glycosyl hydrolase